MNDTFPDYIDWLLKGALLWAAVQLFLYIAKNRISAAGRFLLWLCLFFAIVLLPLFSPIIPSFRVNHVPFQQPTRPFASPAETVKNAEAPRFEPRPVESIHSPEEKPKRFSGIFQVIWLVGSALLLIRFVVNLAHTRSLRKGRKTTSDLLPENVDLYIADSPPMTGGFLRPWVVLPKESADWSEEKMRYVIEHELAHVKRRDSFWMTVVSAVMVFAWVHPLLWLVVRELGRQREFAADDAVLKKETTSPGHYAQCLTEVSLENRDFATGVTMASISASALEKRIRFVVSEQENRREVSKKFGVAVFACVVVVAGLVCALLNPPTTVISGLADDFDFPVGDGTGKGYYVYRGFESNKHVGEDWNGNGGGNTDLGDPVLSIGHGEVVFAEDYRRGWGNVIITRHSYIGKGGEIETVDALYGHLLEIRVKKGETVSKGQRIGSIGCGPKDMYTAHLHFEIRKDTRIGMRRALYPLDYKSYHSPRTFIKNHRDTQPSFAAKLVSRFLEESSPSQDTAHSSEETPVSFEWKPEKVDGKQYVSIQRISDFYSLSPIGNIDDDPVTLRHKKIQVTLDSEKQVIVVNNVNFVPNDKLLGTASGLMVSTGDLSRLLDSVLRPSYIKDKRDLEKVSVVLKGESELVDKLDKAKLKGELLKQGIQLVEKGGDAPILEIVLVHAADGKSTVTGEWNSQEMKDGKAVYSKFLNSNNLALVTSLSAYCSHAGFGADGNSVSSWQSEKGNVPDFDVRLTVKLTKSEEDEIPEIAEAVASAAARVRKAIGGT